MIGRYKRHTLFIQKAKENCACLPRRRNILMWTLGGLQGQWWTGLFPLSSSLTVCCPRLWELTVIDNTLTPCLTIDEHVCMGILPFFLPCPSINNSTQSFSSWPRLSKGLLTLACLCLMLKCESQIRDGFVCLSFSYKSRTGQTSKQGEQQEHSGSVQLGMVQRQKTGPGPASSHLTQLSLALKDHDAVLFIFFSARLATPTIQVVQAVYTQGHSTRV